MSVAQLKDSGFAVAKQALPQATLDEFVDVLCHYIKLETGHLAPESQTAISRLSRAQLPHEGLLALRDIDPEIMRRVVDRCKLSAKLFSVLYAPEMVKVAVDYLQVASPADVLLSYPNFRVDLPSRYSEEETKFSLPWHQEAAYYRSKASESRSLVLHSTLFPCNARAGALEVKAGSHAMELVDHAEYFKDEEQRKHFRVEVPDEAIKNMPTVPLETAAGDVGVIDFKTCHRSGRNESDLIRYTFLIRATPADADDLVI